MFIWTFGNARKDFKNFLAICFFSFLSTVARPCTVKHDNNSLLHVFEKKPQTSQYFGKTNKK